MTEGHRSTKSYTVCEQIVLYTYELVTIEERIKELCWYWTDGAVELPLNTRAATRGNKCKLENYSFHYELRKYSVLPAYCEYSLSDYVVETDNLDKFKTRMW